MGKYGHSFRHWAIYKERGERGWRVVPPGALLPVGVGFTSWREAMDAVEQRIKEIAAHG